MEAKALREDFLQLTPLLNLLSPQRSGRPKVRLYEGTSGFKRMLADTLSAKSEVLALTYVDV